MRLSLIDFFESPTVAQQARRIDASLQDTATTAPPPIARRLRPEVVPMTTSQHGLWFLDQLYPDNGAYNMHRALRLRGPLHLEALGRSLTAASRRHEVFRTVFPAVDGLPVARVLPLADVSIETIDLCKFPPATRELALRKVAALEAGKPFNLGSDPLLRAKLVKMDENDRVLILVTHHIAADGWSLGILLKELAARYSAIVAGESDALLDLPCQFADFVAWQEERLQGETLKSLLDYWRVRLDGIPKQIVLPFDRPRPARPTFRGAKQYFVAESLRLEKLDALADTTGTTRFMVLLAAFGVLLARYSGQNDIVVGSPFANRLTPEAETMIGFFNNTLILRVEQPDELSFRQLLGRVRDTVVGASDHQELSFETLVRALQPVRDVQRMALFQVNFRYQNIQATPLAFTGLAAEPLDVDNGFAKFDLACEMTADANRLRGYIEYSADLFDRRTAQRIAGDFQTLLVEVVTNPDLALQALHSQREESLLTH